MFTKALLLALAASPLVSAHGKVAVVTGDAGGNGTALGIKGGIVPGPGPNRVTEVDTTVFKKVNGKAVTMSDGLGRTNGGGQNQLSMIKAAMAQSGNTLPQVTDGGSISGVFHCVTTDGAGPLEAVIDPTATGAFSKGTMLKVEQQIEGNNGNIKATKKGKRSLPEKLWDRALDALEARGILMRRAANVNRDFNMKFSIPAGTQCTGTLEGMQNVCLVKIANTNRAGPFGGVVAVQMVGAGGATPAAPAATPAASGAATGASNTKTNKAGKTQNRRAVGFSA